MAEAEVVNKYSKDTLSYETTVINKCEYVGFDVDERKPINNALRRFFEDTTGVILVVDSANRENFSTNQRMVQSVVSEPMLKKCKILILANKQDIDSAVSVDELASELGLQKVDPHKYHIEGTCGITGAGIQEGIKWVL